MTYSFIEGETKHIIVNPDCQGEQQKRSAVFAGRLLAAGPDTPGDFEPKNFKPVDIVVAPDTTSEQVALLMGKIGVEQVELQSTL